MSESERNQMKTKGVNAIVSLKYEDNKKTDKHCVEGVDPEKFENGIIAGDLDSLLEMFEEAETGLSSSVGGISLTQNGSFCEADGETSQISDCNASPLLKDHNQVCCASSALELNESITKVNGNDIFTSLEIPMNSSTCHEEDTKLTNPDCSVLVPSLEDFSSGKNNVFGETYNVASSKTKLDISFCNQDIELLENSCSNFSIKSFSSSLETTNVDFQSSLDKNKTQTFFSENSTKDDECFSTKDSGLVSHSDESYSSSDLDDEFPKDDRWSDGSSSPSSGTFYRGRESFTRRDGPRRQQSRGRVQLIEDEKLYDRLPSYYTVFSRPNRTATGLIRNSRSCLKLVLNSDIPAQDQNHSPDLSDQIFNKVPAYQSCFTNSTQYDEDGNHSFGQEVDRAFDLGESSLLGRGHGSGSSYTHLRPRFRSRSRIRTGTGPRERRSGRTCVIPPSTSAFEKAKEDTSSISKTEPEKSNQNKIKQRRILYIGRIPENLTSEQLKNMFEQFGQIEKCTVHFRECGDNYGFVTYVRVSDAYKAVEQGPQLPGCENFDICFGGRRNFCKAVYFDLDGNVEIEEEMAPVISKLKAKHNYDDLLMDELLKRKLQ